MDLPPPPPMQEAVETAAAGEEEELIIIITSTAEEGMDDNIYGEASVAPVNGEEFATNVQLTVGVWAQRIIGIIIVLCAMLMFALAIRRRQHIFHRLVLWMSVWIFIYGAFCAYGAAAVPKTTTMNAAGNQGSHATCTLQGYMLYASGLIMSLYYSAFAAYSFAGVRCNFEDPAKLVRVERYIHAVVLSYPLFSGIYLIVRETFNNTGGGYCFIASEPLGCTSTAHEFDCDRGPQTKDQLVRYTLFWVLPFVVALIFSTVVMIALTIIVKRQQTKIAIPVRFCVRQSLVYLAAMYVGILPSILYHVIKWMHDTPNEITYRWDLGSDIAFTLFGVWCTVVYGYFSIDWNNASCCSRRSRKNHNNAAEKRIIRHNSHHSHNILFGVDDNDSTNDAAATNESTPETSKRKKKQDTSEEEIVSGGSIREDNNNNPYSFNIFDGTNPSDSPYANFIHGADEEDIKEDNDQTSYWKDIQNHL